MKFIMLINVKMPTIVGILTFISRISTAAESLKAKKFYFLFFSSSLFKNSLSSCSFELSMKKVS